MTTAPARGFVRCLRVLARRQPDRCPIARPAAPATWCAGCRAAYIASAADLVRSFLASVAPPSKGGPS